jgi:surfactin synthase thioesterase subunit
LHVPLPRPDAHIRLVCLHHAGGASTMFVPWTRLVDPRIEICAVALPGRGARMREPVIADLGTLLAEMERIWEVLADRPVAFFGHSMGALLAYLLIAEHDDPLAASHLFVSAFGAPDAAEPAEKRTGGRDDDRLVEIILELDPEFSEVLDKPELLQMTLPSCRADFAVVHQWRPTQRPPLSVPITAFGGTDDPRVRPEALQGWASHTTSAYSMQLFEGGHFYLRHHAAEVVRRIEGVLLPLATVRGDGP